jgi:DNA-directed RNA polymerase subunit RPC12/RpoP
VRSLVVSAHKGREVQVDHDPRCSACGKKLGEYFAIPYSIKCRNCGHQAKGD